MKHYGNHGLMQFSITKPGNYKFTVTQYKNARYERSKKTGHSPYHNSKLFIVKRNGKTFQDGLKYIQGRCKTKDR